MHQITVRSGAFRQLPGVLLHHNRLIIGVIPIRRKQGLDGGLIVGWRDAPPQHRTPHFAALYQNPQNSRNQFPKL
ncbi:MAG: hypothetical protein CVV30_07010 [Methanomicrobiales archaeon HGW-Methanomicrobiales-1]|nr:MAG: hypothetical protein CVV30_07010 [Methanomicrobiales archaeon HGW-Methanomicrobiales-1]